MRNAAITLTFFTFLTLSQSLPGQEAQSKSFSFTNISGIFPLVPLAISKIGVVGYVCCQSVGGLDSAVEGFIQSRTGITSSFDLVGLPLAQSAFVSGINSAGTVVGGFCPVNQGCSVQAGMHGFSTDMSGAALTQIDFPAKNVSTIAGGINSQGVIVGSYCPNFAACEIDASQHGFQDDHGTFSTIDFPGSYETSLNGINDSGAIVGIYEVKTGEFGFMLQGGVFTTIAPPNATYTSAQGINNSGVIAGWYIDTQNKTHGFEFGGGVYTTIDYPKASVTFVYGIDDAGEIVGSYRIGNGQDRGFLAK